MSNTIDKRDEQGGVNRAEHYKLIMQSNHRDYVISPQATMMKLLLPLLSFLPYAAAISSSHRSLSVAELSDDFTDDTTLSEWDGIASNRIESVDIIDGELNLVPTTAQTFGYYGNGQGLSLTKTIA